MSDGPSTYVIEMAIAAYIALGYSLDEAIAKAYEGQTL